MTPIDILAYTSKLISIPSVSGDEGAVAQFLFDDFRSRGWNPEKLRVTDDRFNVFVPFGQPEILLTTHIDVVPAPSQLFSPRLDGETLYGRGACDAKGIVATMVATAEKLKAKGFNNFALLFVVGEELDGIGAKTASVQLQGRGIKYIINGEPTEGKVMVAHKGVFYASVTCHGRACHSGYPHLGDDANVKLIKAASKLLDTEMESDPVLGNATINIGLIDGGVASNVVSPKASLTMSVRTVGNNRNLKDRLLSSVEPYGTVEVLADKEPIKLLSVPGFTEGVASYYTDIPNFAALKCETVLYGPGTILVAHTDQEHITQSQVADATLGYEKIFYYLAKLGN